MLIGVPISAYSPGPYGGEIRIYIGLEIRIYIGLEIIIYIRLEFSRGHKAIMMLR